MKYNNSPESGNKNLINLPAVPRMSDKLKYELDTAKDSSGRGLIESRNEDIFNLTPESIFKRFESLSREISSIFEALSDDVSGMMEIHDFQITQTDKNVIINAKIPGLSSDNLDVYIGEDYIRLSGKRQSSNEYRSLDNNSYRAQKSYTAFFRTIPLPVRVNCHQAKVEYNGDVLNISIPKL